MLNRYTPLKRTPFKRKPAKTKTIQRGDREICTGEAWERRREECHDRAQGLCEGYRNFGGRVPQRCGRHAPLHDQKDAYGLVIRRAGHAHHRVHRGAGGAKRDDRLSNLDWLCWLCHDEAHRPKKVVPAK